MLTLDLHVGPGRNPLPVHLGGVLHGFVEGGVKNHAPQLLPILRPNGPDLPAHFMILPPPIGAPSGDRLRFAVILYGQAATASREILGALLAQQACGLNARQIQIEQAWCAHPGSETAALLEEGRLLDSPLMRPSVHCDISPLERQGSGHLHRLSFRSPLPLASRKAQRERERLATGLPWPSLGSGLDSIADRMRILEPELADALGLPPNWTAPDAAHQIEPLTPAATPAQQIEWEYTATPRSASGEAPTGRRTLPIPGIVGDLIYPSTGIEHEHALLHWGQWLGVGQKTTMGCGSYALLSR